MKPDQQKGTPILSVGVCESCAQSAGEYFAYVNSYPIGTTFSCRKCCRIFQGPYNSATAEAKPAVGDTRTVRKFLWLPLHLNGETKWLEWVDIVQVYREPKTKTGRPALRILGLVALSPILLLIALGGGMLIGAMLLMAWFCGDKKV